VVKCIRIIALSIIILLIGLYVPVFIVAVVAGETNFEIVLPYCIANSIAFLGVYLWVENKVYNRKFKRTLKTRELGKR